MVCQWTGSDGFSVLKKKGYLCIFWPCEKAASVIWTTKSEDRRGYNRDWFQLPMTWYLQGVDYCLQSTTSPPNASGPVSHLFSATAISHGLDTRVLLQRNPYNRLTVIKETSLQSNKISNFQLTRDAFQLAVLFSSFLSLFIFFFLLFVQLYFYFIQLQTLLFLKHFKSKCYV